MINCKSIKTTNLSYLLDFIQVVAASNNARLEEAQKEKGEDTEAVEMASGMVDFQNSRISASPHIHSLLDRISVHINLVDVNPLELDAITKLGECVITPVTVRRSSLKESYLNLGMTEEASVNLCKSIYNTFQVDKNINSREFLTQVDEKFLCVANMLYDCSCTLHGGLFTLFYPGVMDIFEGITDFEHIEDKEISRMHDNILRKFASYVYTNIIRELTTKDLNVDAWTYFHINRLDFSKSNFAINTVSFPSLGRSISFVGDMSEVAEVVEDVKRYVQNGKTPILIDVGCRTSLYTYFRFKFESSTCCRIVDHEDVLRLKSEESRVYLDSNGVYDNICKQFEDLSMQMDQDNGKMIQAYALQPLAKYFTYSLILDISAINEKTSKYYFPETERQVGSTKLSLTGKVENTDILELRRIVEAVCHLFV